MKNLLYNLSLFFLLCSCSTQQNDSATLLHVALDKATEDIRTSSFLDTTYCQPIVLEQTQYPIGEISKIQYVNGLFFIMDKHGQKLFSFDEKGECNLLLISWVNLHANMWKCAIFMYVIVRYIY